MAVERRPDGTTRGGNEPPDEVQDTPQQNAGYDAAVRGQPSDEVADDDAPEETNADGSGDRAAGDALSEPFRPPSDTPRRKGAGG